MPSPEIVPRIPPSAGQTAAPVPRWRPRADWRDLLVGRRPEDVLERIMADDPLRLRALAGQRIRATSRFLDADRVVLRAMARIAHGVTVDGPPDDRSWIAAEVDGALEDVVRAERRAVRTAPENGEDGASPDPSPFDVLARPLDLSGPALRRACDAFNHRSPEERRAFFALFVEPLALEVAATACSATVTQVARRARRALEALLDAAQRGEERGEERGGGRP